PASDAALAAELAALADSLAGADVFSGVVYVARGGIPILHRGYGWAAREERVPNDTLTRFELASVGKMFTAAAAARLAEERRLTFESTLAQALPEYPGGAASRRVTVHHLLTHASGIPDFFRSPRYRAAQASIRTLPDYWPIFADRPLDFEPGTRWDYSNSNFILLGSIIERAAAAPFASAVEERVMRRAGIPSVYRPLPGALKARGYTRVPAGAERGTPADPDHWYPASADTAPPDTVSGGPAGGGTATAAELGRFVAALAEGRIVSPRMVERMLTGYIATEYGGRDGYGFETRLWNGVRIVGHGGAFPGVSNQVDFYPDLGYTVVVLGNTDGSGAQALAYRARLRLAARGTGRRPR
ncbi:MAG TPA: serine hydrolase domain-containing protein, partial [Longimicrobiaceae bacterium]|nr:serine hydrolase domain-containing protein [Longimicrobiaceae bacterium]